MIEFMKVQSHRGIVGLDACPILITEIKKLANIKVGALLE